MVRAGVVDAFTDEPFGGNPAAVVHLDEGARDERWLQAVAAEFNLSETAFLRPQGDAEYGLRWFTPAAEVELCGHATLAAAHRLWEAGLEDADTLTFHTASGPLQATRSPHGITLDFPAVPIADDREVPGVVEALGGDDLDYLGQTGQARARERNGVVLASPDIVRALNPDLRAIADLPLGGVIVTAAGDEDGVDMVSRYFAPAIGIDEDPVTGSAHCTLGPYWAERLGRPELVAHQASPRGGRLRVVVDGDRVLLTGRAVSVADVELRV